MGRVDVCELLVRLLVNVLRMAHNHGLGFCAHDEVPKPIATGPFLFAAQERNRIELEVILASPWVAVLDLHLKFQYVALGNMPGLNVDLVIFILFQDFKASASKEFHYDLLAPLIIFIVGLLDKLSGLVPHSWLYALARV